MVTGTGATNRIGERDALTVGLEVRETVGEGDRVIVDDAVVLPEGDAVIEGNTEPLGELVEDLEGEELLDNDTEEETPKLAVGVLLLDLETVEDEDPEAVGVFEGELDED